MLTIFSRPSFTPQGFISNVPQSVSGNAPELLPRRTVLPSDTFERSAVTLSNSALRSGNILTVLEKSVEPVLQLKGIDLSNLDKLSTFQLQNLVTQLVCIHLPTVLQHQKQPFGKIAYTVLEKLFDKADGNPAIQGSMLINAEKLLKSLLPEIQANQEIDRIYTSFANNPEINPFKLPEHKTLADRDTDVRELLMV